MSCRNWKTWSKRISPRLVLFARRWARDQAEAEDWVQEAFTRFWQHHKNVEAPELYLHGCVRNIAIDVSRRRESEKRRDAEWVSRSHQQAVFHCAAEQDEWRQQVEEALRQLPSEQSEVVVLKIWSELTFVQIAELIGVPLGTVTSRYRYALNSLKSLLSEHVIDDR